jgi:hypothetical protein
MKTEWHFYFETQDFIFEKEHKYNGIMTYSDLNKDVYGKGSEAISFHMTLIPDKDCMNPAAEQTGSLFITLPLQVEAAAQIVKDLAFRIAQRISFESGEFNIIWGMVTCKSIPETPKEEKEIGDKIYSMELHIEEVIGPRAFDTRGFGENSRTSLDIRLVSQYNASKKSQNPIDKFIGFFRILESQVPAKNKKQSLRKQLQGNERLFKIYAKTFKFESIENARDSFNKFIAATVCARHRCAHLKPNENFGYVPIDPRIKEEVEPLLSPLQALTRELIICSAGEKQ